MRSQKVKLVTLAAVFSAIIFMVTAIPQIHIPMPGGQGYVHLGDCFIYLAACFLPTPYAVAAAVIGSGLSDALLGAMLYILPTALIKGCMAATFSRRGPRLVTLRNIIGLAAASVILIGGYFLADAVLFGNWVAPVASLPWNAAQALGSAALFLILGAAMDKADLKTKLLGDAQ